MDAEQKYTGDSSYDVDQNFIDKIKEVPISVSISVAKLIDDCYESISYNSNDSQVYGGVIHPKKEAIFFNLEIYKSEDEMPYLIDFNLIDADDYLDLILKKTYLK